MCLYVDGACCSGSHRILSELPRRTNERLVVDNTVISRRDPTVAIKLPRSLRREAQRTVLHALVKQIDTISPEQPIRGNIRDLELSQHTVNSIT
jgi:hypothetical protein